MMRIAQLALSSCLVTAFGCSTNTPPSSVATTAACERVGDTSRTVSQLFASGDIYAAREIEKTVYAGRATLRHGIGTELYVHATPGLTGQYLQRTLECYTASGQSVHPSDPFHPASGSVANLTVLPAGDSFAVQLVGSDHDATQDIWRRARTLTATSGAEQVSTRSGSARF